MSSDSLKRIITQLREDFLKGILEENLLGDIHPFQLFEEWLQNAVDSKVPEVQAMTLATCTPEGYPSARIVYLREFENDHFYFYGNYGSRKAKELLANPRAALLFFWPALERQIRIEGNVEKAPEEFSERYFNNRPRESQIGAWASSQSQPISSRKVLEDAMENFRQEFNGKEVPRPEWWGGWRLKADYYEFWQGRKSRLHDRLAYRRINEQWQRVRLSP